MTKSLIVLNIFLGTKPLIWQAPRRGIPGLEVKSAPTCELVFPGAEFRVFFFHDCREVEFRWLRRPFEPNHPHSVGSAQLVLTSTRFLGDDHPSPQLCHQSLGFFAVWSTSGVLVVCVEILFFIYSKIHLRDVVPFSISSLSRGRLLKTHLEEALAL